MQNNHSFKKLGKTTLVSTLALGMMVTPIISSIQANAAEGAKGSISDAMFEDLNGNGQKDANEAGISGIKITLFNDQGVEVATTTSAADGSYNFDSVDEGTYYMHVDTATFPANYKLFTTQGFGSDGNSSYFHVAAGETVSGYHLGFYKKAGGTISSTVFNDLNINGKQDEGESGLSGAKVALYNVSGEKIAETTTAADGSYTFANIPAGTYYEHVTLPKNAKLVSGEQFGSDGNTGYFAVNSEQQITNLNVGAKVNTAAISGTITDKASQQGMKDIEMVLFTIDGTRVASTTTDASGNYKFANLAEDFYYVHAIVPDGDSVVDTRGFGMDAYSYYIQIGADTQADNFNLTLKGNTVEPTSIVVNTDDIAAKVGDKGKIDASVQPSDATDKTLTYTVSDPSILSVDADGNWTALAKGEADITVTTANGISKVIHVVVSEKVGELKSFVFEDTNKNGTKEAGEAGVPGATVQLHGADGSVVATQTTDANGQYDFKDVPVGTYYIVVTAPAGYDIKPNHAFGADGVTGYINLTESTVTNYECAVIKDVAPVTVSSIKWINNKEGGNVELMDRDNIQIQDNYVDADNNPIVNIKLYDQNNNVIDLTGYTVTMGDDTIATGAIDGNNVELTRHKAGATSVTIKDPSGRVVKNFVLNITASVIPATDITLGATNIDTTIGTTGKIDATVQPANATDKSLTYTSANTNILAVAADGTWEAKGEGTTSVTVKTANNITKTITVNVTSPISVQLKNIPSYPDRTIVPNDQLNITTDYVNTYGSNDLDFKYYDKTSAEVNPANYTVTSSDTSVISLKANQGDGYMRLSVNAAGSSVITIKDAKGNIIRQFTVNVAQGAILPTGVTVANSAVTTKVASTGSISATVQPANATNKALTYTSSNPDVLKVNPDGSWEAMNNGTATVTVKTSNGLTTTVTFTVQAYFSTILEQGNFNPDKANGGAVMYYDSIADLSASDNITLTYNTLDAKVADTTQTNGRRQFIFYVDGNPVNFNTDYSFSISNPTVLNSDISNNTEGARTSGHIEVKVTKGTSKITVTRTSDGKVVKTINVTVQ
ncbi:SdrD B-like domain-containing protein [Listeria booriae]|uniref:SdrD B-like domain-containing protein n=1 Tax=Listeria booriae TaxID=1552123 RepID=UPI00287FF643|nr:SdrD B-like domain-containing protein [Listeria booriae]MDT0111918.1 SdrD B-like domain-containing protein [Listeria booriae]